MSFPLLSERLPESPLMFIFLLTIPSQVFSIMSLKILLASSHYPIPNTHLHIQVFLTAAPHFWYHRVAYYSRNLFSQHQSKGAGRAMPPLKGLFHACPELLVDAGDPWCSLPCSQLQHFSLCLHAHWHLSPSLPGLNFPLLLRTPVIGLGPPYSSLTLIHYDLTLI